MFRGKVNALFSGLRILKQSLHLNEKDKKKKSLMRSPALWVDSLPGKSQRKPKNTGVGSLFLLQRIFPTQESNRGLLHCRRILYQLSYQRIARANPFHAFLLASGSLLEIFDIP